MPAVEILIAAVLERAVPPAIEAVKRLYSGMGWAKDKRRVQIVQAEVTETIEQSAALARVIPAEHLQPHVDQALARFQSRLLAEQIPAEDAEQLASALRRQIETTVIEPLQHRSLVSDRLESLEADSLEGSEKLAALSLRVESLETRISRYQHAMWFAFGAIGALALIAAVLALVALAVR